jgi:hypothetical protein
MACTRGIHKSFRILRGYMSAWGVGNCLRAESYCRCKVSFDPECVWKGIEADPEDSVGREYDLVCLYVSEQPHAVRLERLLHRFLDRRHCRAGAVKWFGSQTQTSRNFERISKFQNRPQPTGVAGRDPNGGNPNTRAVEAALPSGIERNCNFRAI